MTAGDSKAALTTTPQPALAAPPQPRPAPTARALPPGLVAQVGQNWTPIVGQNWMPIDTQHVGMDRKGHAGPLAEALDQGMEALRRHRGDALRYEHVGAEPLLPL